MGWLCCRTVLIALRETCIFTTARAATFVAAKAARVPHGRAAVVRRRRSLTNGDSRDKATCIHGRLAYAFVRLRRPKAPLRELFLPRPPDDVRSALPILALACVLRGKRRARTPCPPSMRHGGGRRAAFDSRKPCIFKSPYLDAFSPMRQTEEGPGTPPAGLCSTLCCNPARRQKMYSKDIGFVSVRDIAVFHPYRLSRG